MSSSNPMPLFSGGTNDFDLREMDKYDDTSKYDKYIYKCMSHEVF